MKMSGMRLQRTAYLEEEIPFLAWSLVRSALKWG